MSRTPNDTEPTEGAGGESTIFDLLTAYHRSLENMAAWLDEAGFEEVERMGIVDAWQAEMTEWFRSKGYCFACNRRLELCHCDEGESP
ncbi:MAG: hypothetical protein Q9Q40_13400 [Acidobacteriota bacterium]|nr:hypothetical protein [Acidobacteriota bacterium]